MRCQAWTQYSVEPEQVDRWVENLRKVHISSSGSTSNILLLFSVIIMTTVAAPPSLGIVFLVCVFEILFLQSP